MLVVVVLVVVAAVAAEAVPVKADRLSTSRSDPSTVNKPTRKELCRNIVFFTF
jgi:hypothetical protein